MVFFVHIPKTGGTSIEKTLKKAGAAEAMKVRKELGYAKSTMQHMHADIYVKAVGANFADYSFTIIRNPFDRFASEFKMKVIANGLDGGVHEWAETNFKRFGEFAYTRDNHIRPQVQFLSKRLEIFRFEDGLQAPLDAACRYLDLNASMIRHEKRGSAGRLQASPQAIEAIRTFYKDDFSEFGYDVDDFENAFELVE